MIKLLKNDTRPEFQTDAQVINMKDLMGVKTMVGITLRGTFPRVSMLIRSASDPADYFSSGSLYFIVSEKLKAVIESVQKTNIEYFDIEVRHGGKLYNKQKYYFGNILGQIDCFDFTKSSYTQDGEFVNTIKRLQIDESKCSNEHLFRVAKTFFVIIGVSELLINRIEDAGCTGVRFINPEDSKW